MEPLSPGEIGPDFSIPSECNRSALMLSDLRGQPVVLAFSPPGWNPAQAEGLAHTKRLLSQAGFPGELLDLSQNGVWCEATFCNGPVQFPLLTNWEMESGVASRYGVAGKQALFVLDGAGVIRWRYAAEPGVAPRLEDLLAGLQSLAPIAEDATPTAENGNVRRGLTRREFVAAALGVALALALPLSPTRAADAPAPAPTGSLQPPSPVGTVPVTLHVNGVAHALQIEPRVTLLDALRERLNLTGSKKGCDQGQCGACTVHVNGRRVNSCLTLAVACSGKQITTVEGLAPRDTLHPMQAAFIQHDGFQCGFCTSGQIMSAVALLKEPVGPTDADVRENMSGNLCRCGAYPGIVAAVQDVRKGGTHASV